MTSKLIDKMLPSATNHKVDVTVKKWEGNLIWEEGGRLKKDNFQTFWQKLKCRHERL